MPAPAVLNTHLITVTIPVGPLLAPFRKSPIHVVLPTLVTVQYGQEKQLGSPSALNNLHFEPGPKYVPNRVLGTTTRRSTSYDIPSDRMTTFAMRNSIDF